MYNMQLDTRENVIQYLKSMPLNKIIYRTMNNYEYTVQRMLNEIHNHTHMGCYYVSECIGIYKDMLRRRH